MAPRAHIGWWTAAVCGVGVAAAVLPAAAQVAGCDRACLVGVMDTYVAALVAHDPAKAPLARGLRFTENTGILEVGEGLWIGATEAPPASRIYVPDPATDQVALVGAMREFDRPVLAALRLRVLNQRVVEAEHVVVRSQTEPGVQSPAAPRAAFDADVAATERVSRAEVLRVADSYYDALVRGRSADTVLANDCVRHENGRQVSSTRSPAAASGAAYDQTNAFALLSTLGCAAQIDAQMFASITSIDLRRVQIVDEQKGLVFGLTMFRHLGRLRTLPLQGVPGLPSVPATPGPIDLQAAHVFKIAGGAIQAIESIGYTLPYKSNSGWER